MIEAGYELDDKFIGAHHQPVTLMDLVCDQGAEVDRLLRHTGLFYHEVAAGRALASPRQYLQLIHNARRLYPEPELSFLHGQRLFPGHYGAVSALLGNAPDLGQALAVFESAQSLISPLLTTRVARAGDYCCVQWLDACGAGDEYRFLVETMMAGLASVTRWLSGERLPWIFQFSYPRPAYPEQYRVHLGSDLHFDAHMDAMLLPAGYLDRPWPRASATARALALRDCEDDLARLGFRTSFIQALYNYLRQRVREPVSLEQAASALGASPATLKRRLRRQGTHFQQLLDRARKHEALHLLQLHGYSNDQVARHLSFNDPTNFRRSFKRWTGLTPSACRRLLARTLDRPDPSARSDEGAC